MEQADVTTVGLLHVSVDVSQSRLTALFDNILTRLTKLESLQGPVTNVYNNSHMQHNHTHGNAGSGDHLSKSAVEEKKSSDMVSVKSTSDFNNTAELAHVVGKIDTNAPIQIHDGQPVSLQTMLESTANDMNEKSDKLAEILTTLEARLNTVESNTGALSADISSLISVAVQENLVISEKAQEAIDSKLSNVAENVLVIGRKTENDITALDERLESVVERAERKERQLSTNIDNLSANCVHVDDWMKLQKTVVQHGLQIDLFLRKYNEEQRQLQEKVSLLEARFDDYEKHTEEQLEGQKLQAQQTQTMTLTLNDNNRALTSQYLTQDGEVRQHASQQSGAVSRLQLRLVDLAAMIGGRGEAADTDKDGVSLQRKGADAPVLRDIRTAMSGLAQRVESAESALLSVGKYVRDQQERSDRMYTGSMKAVRDYVEQGSVRLQKDNAKTLIKLRNNLDRLKGDQLNVLNESIDNTVTNTHVTAVGKVKCLTCDQPVPTVTGGVGLLQNLTSKTDKGALLNKQSQTITNVQEKTWNYDVLIDSVGTAVSEEAVGSTNKSSNSDKVENIAPTIATPIDSNNTTTDTYHSSNTHDITVTDLGNVANEHSVLKNTSPCLNPEDSLTTKLRINRGEAVTLEGTDGNVYRGRANTRVLLTNDAAPVHRFHVSYQDKDSNLAELAVLQHSGSINNAAPLTRPQTQKSSKRTKLRSYNSTVNNNSGWSGLSLNGFNSNRPSTVQQQSRQPSQQQQQQSTSDQQEQVPDYPLEGSLDTLQGGSGEEGGD